MDRINLPGDSSESNSKAQPLMSTATTAWSPLAACPTLQTTWRVYDGY